MYKAPFSLSCFIASSFFFFNDTATTEIYTLSLHDALPIAVHRALDDDRSPGAGDRGVARGRQRSEEHTSELQSQSNLVCRLLIENKKKIRRYKLETRIQNRRTESRHIPTPK